MEKVVKERHLNWVDGHHFYRGSSHKEICGLFSTEILYYLLGKK